MAAGHAEEGLRPKIHNAAARHLQQIQELAEITSRHFEDEENFRADYAEQRRQKDIEIERGRQAKLRNHQLKGAFQEDKKERKRRLLEDMNTKPGGSLFLQVCAIRLVAATKTNKLTSPSDCFPR